MPRLEAGDQRGPKAGCLVQFLTPRLGELEMLERSARSLQSGKAVAIRRSLRPQQARILAAVSSVCSVPNVTRCGTIWTLKAQRSRCGGDCVTKWKLCLNCLSDRYQKKNCQVAVAGTVDKSTQAHNIAPERRAVSNLAGYGFGNVHARRHARASEARNTGHAAYTVVYGQRTLCGGTGTH